MGEAAGLSRPEMTLGDACTRPGRQRSQLLPHCTTLVMLDLLAALVSPFWALPVLMAGSCGYMAYIVLKVRDVLRDYSQIGDTDRLLLRWSGVVAPVPLALFLGAVYGLESAGFNVNVVVFGHASGWVVVTTLFEVGFITALGAFGGWDRVQHAPPALVWRLLSLPLLGIYFLYLLMTITRGFGEYLG